MAPTHLVSTLVLVLIGWDSTGGACPAGMRA
jgi:hypothetical protein